LLKNDILYLNLGDSSKHVAEFRYKVENAWFGSARVCHPAAL